MYNILTTHYINTYIILNKIFLYWYGFTFKMFMQMDIKCNYFLLFTMQTLFKPMSYTIMTHEISMSALQYNHIYIHIVFYILIYSNTTYYAPEIYRRTQEKMLWTPEIEHVACHTVTYIPTTQFGGLLYIHTNNVIL